MSLASLLKLWRSDRTVFPQIVDWRSLPRREKRFLPIPDDLHPALKTALESQGIQSLYLHQAECWRYSRAGEHVVVVTGTASGKTLCYNLPVLDCLLRQPEARGLYLFPTKALAQDQLAALQNLLSNATSWQIQGQVLVPPTPAIYDGDTPAKDRPTIRKNARLLVSNPDMIHTGILPHHTNWAEFFKGLRFVVIDEMHTYRGVFGSHVANVLRRLQRIAAFYGARPQFILTSATIANPAELAGWLIEAEVALVSEDGSGRGPKEFLIYNPPVIDQALGLRSSLIQETLRLADDLLTYDVQTIIFGRTRRTVELLLTYLRERWDEVRGYRSGYLPGQRRQIEQGLRTGKIRGVVATNALELGIDIGSMEASILAGYPGTIASTWQQAGRAGRGDEASLTVFIASANPLDQFLARFPEYFFGRSPEQGLVNPDNLLILLGHLRCAAFELPFREGEGFGKVTPELLKDFLAYLLQEGSLHKSGNKYFWMADRYPAQSVSLRSASADTVILQTSDESGAHTIGEVDPPSASWMVHPGAIYLHEAQAYMVEELDLEQNIAHLRPAQVDYYTEPRSETTIDLIQKTGETTISGGWRGHGEIMVTMQVVGYRKVRWHTYENLGFADLDLPPTKLMTTGYWIKLSDETVGRLQSEGLWSNAANDYGPGWAFQRQRTRQRDGYRCQMCGIPEAGREHDVHHKVPFRAFNSAEIANQLSNLITLCPTCHRRAEQAVRIRSGLAGLAFALGNLAPLFLMCDTRDLGVHSDAQATLAEGHSAVVLYDRIPAGIGFSERLYELHSELVQRANELVAGCGCADGCPSCVGPGGEGGSGGKREAMALLGALCIPG